MCWWNFIKILNDTDNHNHGNIHKSIQNPVEYLLDLRCLMGFWIRLISTSIRLICNNYQINNQSKIRISGYYDNQFKVKHQSNFFCNSRSQHFDIRFGLEIRLEKTNISLKEAFGSQFPAMPFINTKFDV